MFFHSQHFQAFKLKIDSLDIKNGKNVNKLILPYEVKDSILKNNETVQMMLNTCIHTSDISLTAKTIEIAERLSKLVYEEFFVQGDREKELGLSVSMLCDRNSTNIPRFQIGFIKFVVMPQFMQISNVIPEISEYLDNLSTNLGYYEWKVSEDENNKNGK